MSDTPIRSQAAPASNTEAELYTAVGPTVISTIRACNTGRVADAIRIRKVLAGEAESTKQYLVYAQLIPPGQSYAMTEGEALVEDDVLYVHSMNGTTGFNLSGMRFS